MTESTNDTALGVPFIQSMMDGGQFREKISGEKKNIYIILVHFNLLMLVVQKLHISP